MSLLEKNNLNEGRVVKVNLIFFPFLIAKKIVSCSNGLKFHEYNEHVLFLLMSPYSVKCLISFKSMKK